MESPAYHYNGRLDPIQGDDAPEPIGPHCPTGRHGRMIQSNEPGGVVWACLTCGRSAGLVDPAGATTRCADCGELGERTGHMGCQYPQDRP